MFGVGKAGGIAELRLLEAKLAGPRRHLLGKGRLAAGHAFGDGDAGVVGRLHDDALDEIGQLHPRIEFGIHGRAARGRSATAPGILGDQEFLIHGELARLEALEHHDHGHQLAHAGGRNGAIGVFLEQHLAGAPIDQNGLERLGLERRRGLGVGRGRKAEKSGKGRDQAE